MVEIRVETSRFRVSIARNGGKAPVYVTNNLSDLPEDCIRTERKPDNETIRSRLEAGEVVPGCSIGERGTSLRIK